MLYTKRRINELLEIIRHNFSDENGGVPNVSIRLLLVLVAYIENNNREKSSLNVCQIKVYFKIIRKKGLIVQRIVIILACSENINLKK